MDPVSRARALVKRGHIPKASTIADLLEACETWEEAVTIAKILKKVLPVSMHNGTIAVTAAVKRRGNDIAVTKVVARRDDGEIKVRVVSCYA